MEVKAKPVLEADPSSKLETREKRLKSSCQEFSSVLIAYMMKTMREGASWDGDSGLASGIYQDMLSGQVAKVIARSSTLGIGDMLYSQLARSMKTQQKLADTPAEAQGAVAAPSPDKPQSGIGETKGGADVGHRLPEKPSGIRNP